MVLEVELLILRGFYFALRMFPPLATSLQLAPFSLSGACSHGPSSLEWDVSYRFV